MNNNFPTVLVLGATGQTGSRVAARLKEKRIPVRTAARSGADVAFDWSDPNTYAPALAGVKRVYLMAPVLRTDFAPDLATFLDAAESAGVEHVTFLSAYGMEHAPAGVATRAVELDLIRRNGFTHTILRPAWFMQNFSGTFLRPINGVIAGPAGDGAEAFIDVEDIAAVAAESLADPTAHAGAAYSLTGPEALTFAQAAKAISQAADRTIVYQHLDREVWVEAFLSAGIPADYGTVLRQLTETISSGNGSRPNHVVETVTGQPARSLAEFAAANADAWAEEVSA